MAPATATPPPTRAAPSTSASADVGADRQTLNAADRLMHVAHNGMRELGHGGFLCQTHVWIKGRVDAAALHAALQRVAACYPVMTARLEEPSNKAPPFWAYRPDATVELIESDVASDAIKDVHAYAERLFDAPLDNKRMDPVQFHLLHRPGAGDVLLVRFSHVLMDGKAPEFMLQQINKALDGDTPPAAPREDHDELAAHLQRFPRKQRVRAALRVAGAHARIPRRSAMLVSQSARDWQVRPYGIAHRRLDKVQTDRLAEGVKKVCGFVNLAPAVLACAFRAVSRLAPDKPRRTGYQTDLPLNLRPPLKTEPIFCNFMSFIQLNATEEDMVVRDALIKKLHGQMREQLRRGIDLGNLQMMHLMAPHARLLRGHIIQRMRKHPFTMGFGYLGPIAAGLETFGGQSVTALYSLNSAIAPPGITLQASQFRGRLQLNLTYIRSAVPPALAGAFLDAVVEDLCA